MPKSPPPKKQRLNDTHEDDKTVVAMETERQHSTDITTKLFDEKKGQKNLKSFLHGITYQQKLLLITFLCGASSENEFSLITEDEKAGKFDDIVYTQYDNNHPMITFIQAKHSQDETKKITFKNLTSKVSNDKFCLGKYFLSYLSIKNSYGISSIEKVILCSNIDLSKECLDKHEIQINHVKETIFKNKSFLLYQLIQEKDNNQEPNDCPKALINYLTNSSQLSQLADCLVNLCMKNNVLINASDSKTATFCSGFLDGSRKGETFYEMFKNVYEKDGKRNLVDLQNNGITFEKTINFGVNFLLAPFQLDENECDTFVDEIMSLMNQNEEIPLYRKQPKAINRGFIGKLAGRVIFSTNAKDVYKFGTCIFKEDLQNSRGEDRSNNIEIQKLRNAFIKKLKYCNKGLNDLKKFKMRISNYYTCSEDLIPHQSLIDEKNDVEDIQEFLKKLYFLKTPTDNDLVKVLNTELKTKILTQPYFNVDFSRAFMSEIILNWMKEKFGCPLNKQKAMDAIKEMNQKIAILEFAGNNFRYFSKLKNYNISFNETEECRKTQGELKNFLNDPNKRSCLFHTEYYLFGALKMLRLLDNKEIDSFVFDKAKHLSRNFENVQLIFRSKTGVDLAIVVCKNGENFDFEDLIKNAGKNKKVIVVSKNNKINNFDQIIYDNTNIQHFSDDAKNKVLETQVNFQGNSNILLKDLLANNLNILDSSTLFAIIKNKNENKLEIGKAPETLPADVQTYYIQRKLLQNIVFDSDILKKASSEDCFVIETMHPFPEKNNYVKYVDAITNIDDYKRNTHYFKRKGDKLIWQRSWGFVNKLLEEKREGTYTFEDAIRTSEPFLIIANVAGMGKSTILPSLTVQYKQYFPTAWVAVIKLSEYRQEFDSLNHEEILEQMLRNQLTSDFTKRLYECNCNQRKVLIIFDGYDEIDADYRIKLKDLMDNLRKSKANIWITTRTYLQVELEKLFNVFSLSLEPLGETEQIELLLKFWKSKYEKIMDEWKNGRLKKYAEAVVEKFCQNIDDEKNLYGSIPLQLKMLAEYFHGYKKAHDDCEKCYDFIENEKNEEPLLPETLDLYCLYKTFTAKITKNVYLKEKQNIFSKDVATLLLKEKEEIHEILALKRLLKEECLPTVLSGRQYDKIAEINISEKIGTVGIVNEIDNGKVDFVHLTFAEYYASVAFAKKLFSNMSLKKNLFIIIDDLIPTLSTVFVVCISKVISERLTESTELLNGKSLANFALAENFNNLFQALIKNGLENFLPHDIQNKTPLHYAAEKGNLEAVEFLLAYNNDLMETEILKHDKFKRPEYKSSKLVMYTNLKDIHGKTALCYSVEKTKDMAIMCKLLLNGANISFLKDSLNKIISYLTNETKCVYASDHENRPLIELLLLQAPNAVKDLDTRYSFPRLLSYLFLHGRLEVIKRIIDCLDVQKKSEVLNNDDNGVTPLDRVNNSEYLTDKERLEITQYLIENGGKAVKQKNYFNGDCSSITNILQGAARSGHLQTLKTFMVKEEKEKRGMHFAAACDYKQYNVIRHLLKNGSREDLYFEGNGPLHAAVDSRFDTRFINKEILARGYDVNERNEKGETPLFMAIFRNDLSQIINLIQHGADIKVKTNEGQTSLNFAIKYEQYSVVKYFLLNCNVEKTTPYLNVMYDYYKNPTYDLNGKQNSLLERAIYKNDEILCRFIIKHGKNINIKTKNNKFCLHVAIANKREDIAKLILQYGGIYEADIPLNETIQNSSNSCVSQLLKLLFKISETTKILVKPTLEDSEKDSLVYILNAKNSRHHTLLHLAVQECYFKAVEYLLAKDKEFLQQKESRVLRCKDYISKAINERDDKKMTPLHMTTLYGYYNIAVMLLENGAWFDDLNQDDNIVIRKFDSAVNELLLFVQKCFTLVKEGEFREFKSILIKDNLTIKCIDKKGKNLLHYAIFISDQNIACEMVSFLLQMESQITVVDNNEKTILFYIVENNRMDLLKVVLQNMSYCFVSEFEQITKNSCEDMINQIYLLFYYMEYYDEETFFSNIPASNSSNSPYDLNILCNAFKKNRWTLLHYAVEKGYLRVVKLFLENGATISGEVCKLAKEENIKFLLKFITMLFDNSKNLKEKFAKKLAEMINKNEINYKVITSVRRYETPYSNKAPRSITLLHKAAWMGEKRTAKWLIEKGADINAKDNFGYTPKMLAEENNQTEIIAFLEKFVLKEKCLI